MFFDNHNTDNRFIVNLVQSIVIIIGYWNVHADNTIQLLGLLCCQTVRFAKELSFVPRILYRAINDKLLGLILGNLDIQSQNQRSEGLIIHHDLMVLLMLQRSRLVCDLVLVILVIYIRLFILRKRLLIKL